MGLFLVLVRLFCVFWLFVMCGECCNFGLFRLFAVILIDLSSLNFFFFFSKTKMRVGTLANPYFLNLYISTFFFFFLRVGTCPPWSHTGSANAWTWGRWALELNQFSVLLSFS